MITRSVAIALFLLLAACKGNTDDIVRLNDELISLRGDYFQIYYTTTEIGRAEEALIELLEVAEDYRDRGAKSEPILWDVYFRLADICDLTGRPDEARAYLQDAITCFVSLDSLSSSEAEVDQAFLSELLSYIDDQRGYPVWKNGFTGGLI